MLLGDTNIIGDIGENITATRLGKTKIFIVYLLGGKTPLFDLLIEINDEEKPYQALIQVKTASQQNKYTQDGSRIKTPITSEKLFKLIKKPMPTYVCGVDLDDEKIFIAPAFDSALRYPSVPTNRMVDKTDSLGTLNRLKEDIINFWETNRINELKTEYNSIL